VPGNAVTELLSAEGAILRDPTDVERALTALWKEAGGRPGDRPVSEVKTRVCMANLVLVARAEEWNELRAVLAGLAAKYPTRTLVLLLGDRQAGDRSARSEPAGGLSPEPVEGQRVRAAVASICHLPHPGSPQVCAEQILLRTASDSGTGMDRVLLPLLASDMPLLAWWTVDAAPCLELLKSLRQVIDRLVFDAGLAVFRRLLDPGRHVSRELGWFRSYRWRELIAQLFDEAAPATLGAIGRVEIAIRGGIPTDRIDAIWMLAFMAGQLNWRPRRFLGDGRFEFQAGARTVEMTLDDRGGAGRGIGSFDVHAGEGHFQFTRCGEDTDEFRIMISDAQSCRMPRTIQVRRRERDDSLAVALTGRAVDRSYDRAAPVAVWMAEALAGEQSGGFAG